MKIDGEIQLTQHDKEKLKNDGEIEVTHVIPGYRITLTAEKINLEDFVADDDQPE
jgi:hypothetical protein